MTGKYRSMPDNENKNIYCRRQGNTKLYKLKNYKPVYKYEYFFRQRKQSQTLR